MGPASNRSGAPQRLHPSASTLFPRFLPRLPVGGADSGRTRRCAGSRCCREPNRQARVRYVRLPSGWLISSISSRLQGHASFWAFKLARLSAVTFISGHTTFRRPVHLGFPLSHALWDRTDFAVSCRNSAWVLQPRFATAAIEAGKWSSLYVSQFSRAPLHAQAFLLGRRRCQDDPHRLSPAGEHFYRLSIAARVYPSPDRA